MAEDFYFYVTAIPMTETKGQTGHIKIHVNVRVDYMSRFKKILEDNINDFLFFTDVDAGQFEYSLFRISIDLILKDLRNIHGFNNHSLRWKGNNVYNVWPHGKLLLTLK